MVIGIELDGVSAKAAVLINGTLAGKSAIKPSATDSAQQTAASLAKLALTAAEKAGKNFEDVTAIGIGSPGVIDSREGVVVNWTNFGWINVELGTLVSRFTGKPVYVLNDANAAALGEAKFGAGKRYQDSVLITLGTGVGSGIMIGGKLFEGYKSAGAEVGHMVIRQDGELCSCGRKGCLERYASATALVRRTKSEMAARPDSAMWNYAHSMEEAGGRTAFLAFHETGDEAAERVIKDYVAALGEGIVNVFNILRPEAVILGGRVSNEGENLLKPLRDYLAPRVYATDYAPFEVVCATLGNDAGLYGAAQFAIEHAKQQS